MSDESMQPQHPKDFSAMRPVEKMRWAQKRFHPEAGGTVYEPAPGAHTVNSILSAITSTRDLSEWPQVFADAEMSLRVTFPSRIDGSDDPESRTYFLPATPAQFYDMLHRFAQGENLPKEEYPFVALETVDGIRDTNAAENAPSNEVKEMAKLITRVRKAKKIEDLAAYYTQYTIHKAYPIELLAMCPIPDTGEVASITEEISARAKELFAKKARLATTPEKLADLARTIAEFYFLKVYRNPERNGQYELVWDEPIRQEMLALIESSYVARFEKVKKADFATEAMRLFPDKEILRPMRERLSGRVR